MKKKLDDSWRIYKLYFLKDLNSTTFISSEEICRSQPCDYCMNGGNNCRQNYTENFYFSEEFKIYLEDYLQDMINKFESSIENGRMEYFAVEGNLYWRDIPNSDWELLSTHCMKCDELLDEINNLAQLLY